MAAGKVVRLNLKRTQKTGLHHEFSPKPGCGDLIIGEVSSINDDRTDNYFEVKRLRFIPVKEDCPTEILLCNEYGRLD